MRLFPTGQAAARLALALKFAAACGLALALAGCNPTMQPRAELPPPPAPTTPTAPTGETIGTGPVRVAPFTALSSFTESRPPRPRIACREKIWPPPRQTSGMVETFTAAFAYMLAYQFASTEKDHAIIPRFASLRHSVCRAPHVSDDVCNQRFCR